MSEAQAVVVKRVNPLLALVAILFLLSAMALLVMDVVKTVRHGLPEAPAKKIWASQQRKLSDPREGWFPYQHDPIFGFEQDTQDWKLEADDPLGLGPMPNPVGVSTATLDDANQTPLPSSKPKPSSLRLTTQASEGRSSLSVPVHFPDPATLFRDNGPATAYRFQGVRFIAYDVYVPKDCPGFVSCLFFMKDKDGLWYQARSQAALVPGAWTTVAADIRGGSPDVTPLGHLGQWDENQASQIRTIGITFYGDAKYDGTILVDNFRGWMRAQRFNQMVEQFNGTMPQAKPVAPERAAKLQELTASAAIYKEDPLQIINYRTDPRADADTGKLDVPKFETLTLRFELNREADNPFDPDKADITCQVTSPSGQTAEHIGFWYQDYDRCDRFSGDELRPMGRPEWRVRITPQEVGTYSYTLNIRLGSETLKLPVRKFTCSQSGNKGFIRVSKTDGRFFEYSNGELYYPVGHNISTPVDIRCWKEVIHKEPPAGRGLSLYADFFNKMQANGENLAEVWMASWWLGIEWTSRWTDYHGMGRYSLQHAWKLDYLLEMAHQHGIALHLVLDNHGKFSEFCDWEWDNNPYNIKDNEFGRGVSTPREFFHNPVTRKWHENKLRYIVARWGADPAVMGWELISEYDLVGDRGPRQWDDRYQFHRSPQAQAWAREMTTATRKLDVYNHPTTIHYATDYRWVDVVMARSEFYDYVVTDAYRPLAKRYTRAAQDMQAWVNQNLAGVTKPFWITEYGGDFNAAPEQALISDVQCGPWATWMTDGAGCPLFWWYDLIDRRDLYKFYHGFSSYIKGEERRGIKGTEAPLPVSGGNSGNVAGTCYRWATGAYAWVYDDEAMRMMPPENQRITHTGVEGTISGLQAGKYHVEYWDCTKGEIVSKEDLDSSGTLKLKFPAFVNNMAIKAKLIAAK